MAPGRSNLRGPPTMDEGEGKIAKRSQDLRSRGGPQTRPIFPEDDIANVVRGVLTTPMTSYQGK